LGHFVTFYWAVSRNGGHVADETMAGQLGSKVNRQKP
jgi:hypothetical protein